MKTIYLIYAYFISETKELSKVNLRATTSKRKAKEYQEEQRKYNGKNYGWATQSDIFIEQVIII